MGRGGLKVRIKKFCIIVENNILKNLKKVVTEKVVKSKKPQNYAKTDVLYGVLPDGHFKGIWFQNLKKFSLRRAFYLSFVFLLQ